MIRAMMGGLLLMVTPATCFGQATPVAKITSTSIVLIDISGSRGNVVELITSPEEALKHCQRRQFNGKDVLELYWPGHPKIEFIVFAATGAQKSISRYVIPADGKSPQPPPPPPPPFPPLPPTNVMLIEKVEQITADVEAETHDEVADIFTSLASEIGAGKLRGSGAINEATKAKMAAMNGWSDWIIALMSFLLNDLDLMSQKQWQDAFLVIAKEVVK